MNKKKRIQVAIIVVCLSATIMVIAYHLTGGPIGDTWEKGDVWLLLCRKCRESWQMRRRDYFKYLAKHEDPNLLLPPGVVCPDCGEDGGYRAEKCGKCELIFIRGTAQNDFADRCPECGYSKTERLRKEARKQVGKSTDNR